MEQTEMIKIFDDNKKEIGVATREEAHSKGFWHKTFHCWFYNKDNGRVSMYLQKRSNKKQDYPGLLDITAAGHILSNETVSDGVREVTEETGIRVSFSDLIPLGVINYCVTNEDIGFIDKEIAHVFLYEANHSFDDFRLSLEEVSGIVKVDFNDFSSLWLGKTNEIKIEGFDTDQSGERLYVCKNVGKEAFVPHELEYYKRVIYLMGKAI
ncbi:NUDIX domain-containing protein [Aquibacillus sp. 3ASR75-11]|uniref:NUDIX domain-containing protein n=1 Tax=Terrihalobacillus insolitus TaxID=2950438 RepID=A0A9X4AMD0_9BACI|nr:NUDIX domain-containing protein [Terrihalobacillus insolitus]MDC3411930.1 NUDIX domain-containing protein [Terrihalobacillus insolitus]MDC3423383.1 NUDIX domain-containing protein [Terrihalobacillus insolitus]